MTGRGLAFFRDKRARPVALATLGLALWVGVAQAADMSDDDDETPVAVTSPHAGTAKSGNAPAVAASRKGSGLPVPRFAALRSDLVNFRAGPGTRYPIAWVFKRKGLPVEIVAEFDTWRQVRDQEGSTGWVQRNMLSGKRGVVVTGKERRALLSKPEDAARLVAWVEPGAIGKMEKCQPAWCKACFDGTCGWLPKTMFWGAYPKEIIE